MIRPALALAAALVAATPALAESKETIVVTSGEWLVTHVAFDDGTSACTMRAEANTRLVSLWAGESPDIAFVAVDEAWSLAERQVAIVVTIDGAPWTAQARAQENSIFTNGLTSDFIIALGQGRKLGLTTEDGTELMGFSLEGSAAALGGLLECWDTIRKGDPFSSASTDPF